MLVGNVNWVIFKCLSWYSLVSIFLQEYIQVNKIQKIMYFKEYIFGNINLKFINCNFEQWKVDGVYFNYEKNLKGKLICFGVISFLSLFLGGI